MYSILCSGSAPPMHDGVTPPQAPSMVVTRVVALPAVLKENIDFSKTSNTNEVAGETWLPPVPLADLSETYMQYMVSA